MPMQKSHWEKIYLSYTHIYPLGIDFVRKNPYQLVEFSSTNY